jgi:hypothetical protein
LKHRTPLCAGSYTIKTYQDLHNAMSDPNVADADQARAVRIPSSLRETFVFVRIAVEFRTRSSRCCLFAGPQHSFCA